MIPPRVTESFARVPSEIIGLCRSQPWDDLTRSPGEGMRSIRDVLVHVVGAEAFWIYHVVLRSSAFERAKFEPETFQSPDAILGAWAPERDRRTGEPYAVGPPGAAPAYFFGRSVRYVWHPQASLNSMRAIARRLIRTAVAPTSVWMASRSPHWPAMMPST